MAKKHEALKVAEVAAASAGRIIAELRASGAFEIQRKSGDRNLVTEADLLAEAEILRHVQEAFPDDGVLSEETLASLERDFSGPLWVIDPVDGTTNYAMGHAHVGVSIAYVENGITQAGVVSAPFLGETFSAVRGEGAKLNGRSISCSRSTRMIDALIGTGFPYDRSDISVVTERFSRVLGACRDLRRLGAASIDLCWTACGRLDAFYESLMPWDIAAGALIARESGARVGHIGGVVESNGVPLELWGENLMVAPPAIYRELDELLRSAG